MGRLVTTLLQASAFLVVTHLALVSSSAPVTSPFTLGSGLNLQFKSKPKSSYCLISDPCVHVNALMDSTPAPISLNWVQGIGIRSGKHTLILRARAPVTSAESTGEARMDALTLAMLDYTDVRANLTTGQSVRSEDGRIELGVVAQGEVYLVTVHECGIRLLVRLRFLTNQQSLSVPHFLVDALDWRNMDAPHGIIGQIFPNRAAPSVFTSPKMDHAKPHAREARGPAVIGQSVKAALDELRSLTVNPTVLDGIPEDYLTSGLLAPDCMFSRFGHEGRTGGSTLRPLRQRSSVAVVSSTGAVQEDGEGVEEGEGEEDEDAVMVSHVTLEHVARSVGSMRRQERVNSRLSHVQAQRRMDLLRGRIGGSGSRSQVSSDDIGIIAAMQGTVEVAESQKSGSSIVVGTEQGSKQFLSKEHLEIIGDTQGTVEKSEGVAESIPEVKPVIASSTERWGKSLTKNDLETISSTQGTVEDSSVITIEEAPKGSSTLSSLDRASLEALSSMQGTRDAETAASVAAQGLHLSKKEAQIFSSTQGTLEYAAQVHLQNKPASGIAPLLNEGPKLSAEHMAIISETQGTSV